MKYAVIGMGAVGGYYGSRLAQQGCDVHFLLRSDYVYVSNNGFSVDSYMGSYVLHDLHVYNDARLMPRCDVVIVAMKTTANSQLPMILGPILKPDSTIILMQNGIGVEADVQRMFPDIQLVSGVAFINCMKVGPGRLLHKGYGNLTLGNYSCHERTVIESVAEDFSASGVRTEVADYLESRWRKAVLNLATNGMTVVHNCLCDELISNPVTCNIVRELLMEGIRTAQACGVQGLTDEVADKMIATTGKTHFATSMKYDFDHHQPMEIRYLYTNPIREAETHGVEVPNLRRLHQQLIALQPIQES